MLIQLKNSFNKHHTKDDLFFPFFRMAISLFCLIHLFSILADFDLLFTDNGIVPLRVLSILKSNFLPSYYFIINTLNNFGISSNHAKIIYISLYSITCITLFSGFLTRASAIFLLILHLIIFQSSSIFMYGVDYFKTIALFYCCVFPLGSKMSIDNLVFQRKDFVNPSPYRNLLKIHLCIAYFVSGIDKAFGINWWNGESIWKAIHLPGFSSYLIKDYSIFLQFPIIPISIGISTFVVEFFYPLFINIQKTRLIWLCFVVLFHVGIILCLNLYFFGIMMIILNLSAFLDLTDKQGND